MNWNIFYKRFVIIALIFISSCFCPDTDLDYVKINRISLDTHFEDNQNEIVSIWIQFSDKDYVAEQKKGPFFNNVLYATSCSNKGGFGLKPEIDSIVVTSSNKFNNIQPGISINDYTTSYYNGAINGERLETNINTSELNEYLNESTYTYSINSKVMISQKPVEKGEHIFTVTFYMKNNTILKASTGKINYN